MVPNLGGSGTLKRLEVDIKERNGTEKNKQKKQHHKLPKIYTKELNECDSHYLINKSVV